MKSKDIYERYNYLVYKLKNKNDEKLKNEYLLIFREIENSTNKKVRQVIEEFCESEKDFEKEIKRLSKIVNALKQKTTLRKKLIKDYETICGHKPRLRKDILEETLEDYNFSLKVLKKYYNYMKTIDDYEQKIKGLERKMKTNLFDKKRLEIKIDYLKGYIEDHKSNSKFEKEEKKVLKSFRKNLVDDEEKKKLDSILKIK